MDEVAFSSGGSLWFNGHFSSRCQNISILDFTEAKDNGGGGRIAYGQEITE